MPPLLINAICRVALVSLALESSLMAYNGLVVVMYVVILPALLVVHNSLLEIWLHDLESGSTPWRDLVN